MVKTEEQWSQDTDPWSLMARKELAKLGRLKNDLTGEM